MEDEEQAQVLPPLFEYILSSTPIHFLSPYDSLIVYPCLSLTRNWKGLNNYDFIKLFEGSLVGNEATTKRLKEGVPTQGLVVGS